MDWNINFEGDIILLGKHKSGKIDIPVGEEAIIKSGLIFGFGETRITTIIKDEAGKISTGFMFGPLLFGVN